MMNITISLLFLAIIVAYVPSDARLSCPRGFRLYGAKCYAARDLRASWPEAKEYCRILGGDLVAIKSSHEQSQIKKFVDELHGNISYEIYWIDGSDIVVSREWRWMGSNGASTMFTYTNWNSGEPSNLAENCVELLYDYGSKWNDAFCDTKSSFICEARARSTNEENINNIARYLFNDKEDEQTSSESRY